MRSVVITNRAVPSAETADTMLVVQTSAGVPKYQPGLYYWFNGIWNNIAPLVWNGIRPFVQRMLNVFVPANSINYTTLPIFLTTSSLTYDLSGKTPGNPVIPAGYTINFIILGGQPLRSLTPNNDWTLDPTTNLLTYIYANKMQPGLEQIIFLMKA